MANEATALAPAQSPTLPVAIRDRIEQAVQRSKMLEEMVGRVLEEGKDYDRIPNTDKPTLLQPGAQQLCFVFGFSPKFSSQETAELQADPPFLSYQVTCTLIGRETGEVIAEGVGCANSRERKYESRSAFDMANTLLKMAKKRALVDATLNATAASRLFTQDMEDLREMAQDEDRPARGQRTQQPPRQAPQQQGARQSPPEPTGPRPASDKQKGWIKRLLEEAEATPAEVEAILAAVNGQTASKAIDALRNKTHGIAEIGELVGADMPGPDEDGDVPF